MIATHIDKCNGHYLFLKENRGAEALYIDLTRPAYTILPDNLVKKM